MSERIAIISTSYPRQPGDAAGHFVQSEVTRLLRAGHEVHVFAPGSPVPASDGAELHWLGDHGAFGWPGALARLKERPARWLGVLEFCVRARAALRRQAPFTRVQAHFLVPCAWPIALSATPSSQLELIGHGSDVRAFCRLPGALRGPIARAWLARRASLRVTSSELATALRHANPELSSALRVEASPIDVEGVPTRRAARDALGIPEAKPLVLIVARLIPEKRVALALRALALIDALSAVVVGDGPELGPLRARFPNAHFTGFLPRSEALRWIAAADVLVSASAHEGAPSVVREARALGVPVVAVAAGDLADWATRDPGLLIVGASGPSSCSTSTDARSGATTRD
ncbi:MAG TPA: glycosyltransferase family 4 protein [Polyangiaceae bacterium]|nr:glycosyltransferase family 4 protein [Polyangiaceae bacterium]